MRKVILDFGSRFVTAVFVACLFACGDGSQLEQDKPVSVQSPPAAAPADGSYTILGLRKNFTITKTQTGYSITNLQTKTNILVPKTNTSIRFSDMTVNLVVGDKSLTISDANVKTLVELYIAFFNRVPDADGVSYWIDQIKAGMTTDQLANNFYSAAIQFSSVTGYSSSMTDAEFVRVIYKNVLGRSGATAPPNADVAYWADELASGRSTKGRLIVTMLASARTFVGDATYGWVPQLLDNKVTVGRYFAIQQGLNFNTPDASITNGMLIAGDITPTSTVNAMARIGFNDQALDLTANTATTKAEGVYEGVTSTGAAFNLLVLEDQSYWVIYGTQSNAGLFSIYGFIQGTATSTVSTFYSNNGKDYFYTGTVSDAVFNSTYIPGKSITGSITDEGQTGTFNAVLPTVSSYDYALPAKLIDIVGNWNLDSFQGGSVAVLINPNGDLIGTTVGSTCTFSGKILPRNSRKNVFNLNLTQGAGCTYAGQVVTGIALTYKNSLGKQELLVAGISQNRALGDAFFGYR